MRKLFLLIGAVFITIGIAGFSSTLTALESARAVTPEEIAPDTTPPQPGEPTTLSIPVLSIEADIVKVGRTTSDLIAVPASIDDVGWYRHGPKPGNPGRAIFDGHVDDAIGIPGVFADLETLTRGDEIKLMTHGGRALTYRVTRTIIVPYDSPTLELFEKTLTSEIVLITCTGDWNQDERRYAERVLVFAELE